MRQNGFEQILETACAKLTAEAREKIFPSSGRFEKRVREVLRDLTENYPEVEIDFNPHPQAFPDIAVGNFGVEVKFTLADTWRSVANPNNDDEGGIYIERALKIIENEMLEAALTMDDALFIEYWGESVPPKQRIKKWLEKADAPARNWTPSNSLFLNYARK